MQLLLKINARLQQNFEKVTLKNKFAIFHIFAIHYAGKIA